MTVNTSALAKIYIGPVVNGNAVVTEGVYKPLTYVEIGEVEDIGEFGDKANNINFTALNNRRVRKFKGSFDAGNVSLTLGRDAKDTGQVAVKAAQVTDFDYAFKIVLNDASAGSPSSNSVIYFPAKVMDFGTNIGNVESITKRSVNLAIVQNPLEVVGV